MKYALTVLGRITKRLACLWTPIELLQGGEIHRSSDRDINHEVTFQLVLRLQAQPHPLAEP